MGIFICVGDECGSIESGFYDIYSMLPFGIFLVQLHPIGHKFMHYES